MYGSGAFGPPLATWLPAVFATLVTQWYKVVEHTFRSLQTSLHSRPSEQLSSWAS